MGDITFTFCIVGIIVLELIIIGISATLHMFSKKPSNHDIIIKQLNAIEKTLIDLKYKYR